MVLELKNFTALWLQPVASYLEALFVVAALFTEPKATFELTAPQLLGSFLILFFYLPSPYYFFVCYYDEKIAAMAHWGFLSDARTRDLKEMFAKADPAYQRWEKRMKREMHREKLKLKQKVN